MMTMAFDEGFPCVARSQALYMDYFLYSSRQTFELGSLSPVRQVRKLRHGEAKQVSQVTRLTLAEFGLEPRSARVSCPFSQPHLPSHGRMVREGPEWTPALSRGPFSPPRPAAFLRCSQIRPPPPLWPPPSWTQPPGWVRRALYVLDTCPVPGV